MNTRIEAAAPQLVFPHDTGARLPAYLQSIGHRYPGFHLAQLNIGHMRDSLESPTMRGFVERLDEINRIADESPGFVWRLQNEAGDATYLRPFDDPRILVNLSVWESIGDLWRYVYVSAHKEVMQSRSDWFEKMDFPQVVLWWIPEGTIPSIDTGVSNLRSVRQWGPSKTAFTLRYAFAPTPTQLND